MKWTDGDLQDLHICIAQFAYPRLKEFKKVSEGCPLGLTISEWYVILDKMIVALKLIAENDHEGWHWTDAERRSVIEGTKLFGKWLTCLWY